MDLTHRLESAEGWGGVCENGFTRWMHAAGFMRWTVVWAAAGGCVCNNMSAVVGCFLFHIVWHLLPRDDFVISLAWWGWHWGCEGWCCACSCPALPRVLALPALGGLWQGDGRDAVPGVRSLCLFCRCWLRWLGSVAAMWKDCWLSWPYIVFGCGHTALAVWTFGVCSFEGNEREAVLYAWLQYKCHSQCS